MRLPLALPLLGTWAATQACALIGNRTSDPLVHRPGGQSTEPYQPGLFEAFDCDDYDYDSYDDDNDL